MPEILEDPTASPPGLEAAVEAIVDALHREKAEGRHLLRDWLIAEHRAALARTPLQGGGRSYAALARTRRSEAGGARTRRSEVSL